MNSLARIYKAARSVFSHFSDLSVQHPANLRWCETRLVESKFISVKTHVNAMTPSLGLHILSSLKKTLLRTLYVLCVCWVEGGETRKESVLRVSPMSNGQMDIFSK